MEKSEASASEFTRNRNIIWYEQAKKFCKSLAFTAEMTPSEKDEEMLRRLHVDDLPQAGLQVKVSVYLKPSGNVIVRIPRDDRTKTLVKNLACENWHIYRVSQKFFPLLYKSLFQYD